MFFTSHFFLLLIITRDSSLLIWLVNRFVKTFYSRLELKTLYIFINCGSCKLIKTSLFSITSKKPNILSFSFLKNWLLMIFLVYKQTSLLIVYDISFWCLLVSLNRLVYIAAQAFYTNSEVVCIFPEMSKAFLVKNTLTSTSIDKFYFVKAYTKI